MLTDRQLTQLQKTGRTIVDGASLTDLVDAAQVLGFDGGDLFIIAIGDQTYLEATMHAHSIARRTIPGLARQVGVTTGMFER